MQTAAPRLVFVAQLVFVSLTTDVLVLKTVFLRVAVLEGLTVDLTVVQFVTTFGSRVTADVCLTVLVVVTLTVPVGSVVVRVFRIVTVLAGMVEVLLLVT